MKDEDVDRILRAISDLDDKVSFRVDWLWKKLGKPDGDFLASKLPRTWPTDRRSGRERRLDKRRQCDRDGIASVGDRTGMFGSGSWVGRRSGKDRRSGKTEIPNGDRRSRFKIQGNKIIHDCGEVARLLLSYDEDFVFAYCHHCTAGEPIYWPERCLEVRMEER